MKMEDVPDELFDSFESSETEIEVYCLCNSDVSKDLIECEGPECKIKFYHTHCVGLNVPIGDGPSDWMCYACLGQEIPMNVTKIEQVKKKSSKPRTKRTASTIKEYDFTLEKAQDSAKSTILNTILKLKAESFCQLNSSFVDILSVTMEKLQNNNAADEDCKHLIQHLWPAVIQGDNSKQLISTRLEKKTVSFHRIRGSNDIKLTLKKILTSLEISEYSAEIFRILSQFLFHRLFQELLNKRHQIPSTQISEAKSSLHNISKSEEQALRFTAGYVCRKLSRHFGKYKKNKMSEMCWAILQNFKTSESDVGTENLLAYTKEWINIVNRGGLFTVSDPVYVFFKEMELIFRSNLNSSSSSLYVTKDQLHQKIQDSEQVNEAYMELMNEADSEEIKFYLLNRFIKCWVSLRLKAFAKVFMYIKKKQEGSLSRSGQKSMRKELDKENK